jgi:dTDP-glucose 4,6-dehydratase
MKHIIIGGDGFVGRHLASDLATAGQDVLVADIHQSDHEVYKRVPFVSIDVTKQETLAAALPLTADDMVYNLSARMLSPIQRRSRRHDFFFPVNTEGTRSVLEWMDRNGAKRLVHFTTDMVYGHAKFTPQTEDHPTEPLGEYGLSKLESEKLCRAYRAKGFSISIFRPRLIIGPGRLGVLSKLFRLVDAGFPIPMIGSGANPYQFISVFDCASAAFQAWKSGVPNDEFNLGSDDPPPVRQLLTRLIQEAGSRSWLMATPAWAVKLALTALDGVNLPLMDPEQYLIADEVCIVDTRKAKTKLNWTPRHRDEDMLLAAYHTWRAGKQPKRAVTATAAIGGKP